MTLGICITVYMYTSNYILSYHVHVRSLSYIVYDFGMSNEIITQKILVIDPCSL